MKALDRKLLRDLWQMRSQVVTVALVVASAFSGFAGSLATYYSLEQAREQFYESARFGHVFADIKRYSTEDLRWFKEIPDVLERVLAGSGRMIITTPREQHPIVIEHVLRIGSIDEKVADILGTKRVVLS